jgi:hypothetical protein
MLRKPDLYGIKVPNVWLVGYGLDDRQEKRNWPILYACPKIEGVEEEEADQMFENNHYYENVRLGLFTQVYSS